MTRPFPSSECSYVPKNRPTESSSHHAPPACPRAPPLYSTLRHFSPQTPTGQCRSPPPPTTTWHRRPLHSRPCPSGCRRRATRVHGGGRDPRAWRGARRSLGGLIETVVHADGRSAEGRDGAASGERGGQRLFDEIHDE